MADVYECHRQSGLLVDNRQPGKQAGSETKAERSQELGLSAAP